MGKNSGRGVSNVGQVHNNYVSGVLCDDLQLASDFLSEYTPEFLSSAIDWSKLATEPNVYVDKSLKGSVLDVAFSAPYAGFDENQRFVVIVEHKSGVDRWSALQLLRYCSSVADTWRSNKRFLADGRVPWPLPILLHNGPREWTTPTLLDAVGACRDAPGAKEFEEYFVPTFRYSSIDLAAFDYNELRGNPMVRSFLEVLKRGTDGTVAAAVRELKLPWIQKDPYWDECDPKRLENFIGRTLHYIDYSARISRDPVSPDEYRRMLEATDNVRMKEEMESVFEQFRAEGRVEGRVEGRAEGFKEGYERCQNVMIFDMIQKFLENRFKRVPKRLRDKIDAVGYFPSLEKIQEFAWNAKSLQEVERFVDQLSVQE